MKEYEFKGFKIKEIIKQQSLIFVDETKYFNCYGVLVEYPKYKYNVMIDHKPINDLIEYRFYKLKNIKPIVEKKIREFFLKNLKYWELEEWTKESLKLVGVWGRH